MPFSIASYNILAEAYIRRGSFPHTTEAFLDPSSRLPAVVEAVAALGSDVVCLQEVEPRSLAALRARLEPAGYAAHYAPKAGGKPDGCLTLVRRAVLRPVGMTRLHFHDAKGGDQQSGHVALVLALEHAGGRLAVVNTHLKWDLPERRGKAHMGYRQMAELLRLRAELAPGVRAWILCGDLNVEPDSEVIDLCHQQGLRCAYPDSSHTWSGNQRAKKIDYLLHDAALSVRVRALPLIHDGTPLPSASQPSDHLALRARFDWTHDT